MANLSDNAEITNVTFQGKVQKLPFSQSVLLPSLVNIIVSETSFDFRLFGKTLGHIYYIFLMLVLSK